MVAFGSFDPRDSSRFTTAGLAGCNTRVPAVLTSFPTAPLSLPFGIREGDSFLGRGYFLNRPPGCPTADTTGAGNDANESAGTTPGGRTENTAGRTSRRAGTRIDDKAGRPALPTAGNAVISAGSGRTASRTAWEGGGCWASGGRVSSPYEKHDLPTLEQPTPS